MRTITAKISAWLTGNSLTPKELLDGEPARVINGLGYSLHDMTGSGWSLVGEAEITLIIPDENALIANKVEALKHEKASVLAQAQLRATLIEGQIQELLCIEFKPEVE